MKHPGFEDLETFAAGRVSADDGYSVLWPKAGIHAGRLLELISRYDGLPPRERNFTFRVTPTAIMVSRLDSAAATR